MKFQRIGNSDKLTSGNGVGKTETLADDIDEELRIAALPYLWN